MQLTFPNGEHASVAFDYGEISVGSRNGQGICLPDRSLAPHHASLVSDRRGIFTALVALNATTTLTRHIPPRAQAGARPLTRGSPRHNKRHTPKTSLHFKPPREIVFIV